MSTEHKKAIVAGGLLAVVAIVGYVAMDLPSTATRRPEPSSRQSASVPTKMVRRASPLR